MQQSARLRKSNSQVKADLSVEADRMPGKEYFIDIFRGWCKCCGICAAFCPRECIRMNDEGAPVVVDSARCTGCGWCELHCPDFAISVESKQTKEAQLEED